MASIRPALGSTRWGSRLPDEQLGGGTGRPEYARFGNRQRRSVGKNFASRSFASPCARFATWGWTATGRPLIVIRFDRPDVPYQQPSYQALNAAPTRRP